MVSSRHRYDTAKNSLQAGPSDFPFLGSPASLMDAAIAALGGEGRVWYESEKIAVFDFSGWPLGGSVYPLH